MDAHDGRCRMVNLDTLPVSIPLLGDSGSAASDSNDREVVLSASSLPIHVSGVPEIAGADGASTYDRTTEVALAFLNGDFCGRKQLEPLIRIPSQQCADLYLSERGMSDAKAKCEFLTGW